MNGRVEDAILGRMLSPDPNVPDPTNAQSYNRYSYVNNNPLTFVDPSGFNEKDCNNGCGGSGVDGLPEQSSWSCYGSCGRGTWANSITTNIGSINYLKLFDPNPFGAPPNSASPDQSALDPDYFSHQSPAQSQNSMQSSLSDPSAGGACDATCQSLQITVTGHYMDAPDSPTPTGVNLAPLFGPNFSQYNPIRAGLQTLGVGIGGAAYPC